MNASARTTEPMTMAEAFSSSDSSCRAVLGPVYRSAVAWITTGARKRRLAQKLKTAAGTAQRRSRSRVRSRSTRARASVDGRRAALPAPLIELEGLRREADRVVVVRAGLQDARGAVADREQEVERRGGEPDQALEAPLPGVLSRGGRHRRAATPARGRRTRGRRPRSRRGSCAGPPRGCRFAPRCHRA